VEREHALMMMGIDPRRPDPGHPVAGPFVRAALANDCKPDPEEIDAWTGLDTKGLDPIARRIKQAAALPTEEEGRLQNLEAITERMAELERLMDERFEEVEGPAIEEARRRAMLGSVGTKAAERLRRYEAGHSLDLHRSLNALAKLRKDADARPTLADADAWSGTVAPAPNEPKPSPGMSGQAPAEPELPPEVGAPRDADGPEHPVAPNEAKPADQVDTNGESKATCDDVPGSAPVILPSPEDQHLGSHPGPESA
jgi:hypothetical protein